MKKNYSPNRRKELYTINQQLSGIKDMLHKIEEHVTETGDNREKLENILGELAEIKQHVAKRKNRQPRKRRGKGETEVQTAPKREKVPDSDSMDSLNDLLQNPAIRSFLSEKGSNISNRKKTSEKDGSLDDLLGNVDFAQVIKLLQSPMVQSMLKNGL